MANVPSRIGSLTTLRFFAAAAIVVGHGGATTFFNYRFELFDLRNAVSFFFVLSGYILSRAYSDLDWRTDFRRFMAARVSRLWPAHIATAGLVALAIAPISTLDGAARALINILMLQSLVPLKEWHYYLNAVSWSISTEVIFYLVFPFAQVLARRSLVMLCGAAFMVLVLMISLASVTELSSTEAAAGVTAWGLLYVSPLTRIAEFIAGMVMYQLAPALHRKVAGMNATVLECAALALAFVAMMLCTHWGREAVNGTSPQLGVWLMTSGAFMAFAVLIAIFAAEGGLLSTALSLRPLSYLGEISFSLYLLHQIVIRWLFSQYRTVLQQNASAGYLAYWAISLAGAAFIYHVVEQPLRAPLRRLLA